MYLDPINISPLKLLPFHIGTPISGLDMSISDRSRVWSISTNSCRYSVNIINIIRGQKYISACYTADLVRAGLVVVGCARREDKLTSLATSLEGAKGKVVAGHQCVEK